MHEPNPSGLCQCGCGQPAPLAPQTSSTRGWVKGKPVRYLPGHHLRGRPPWNKGKPTGKAAWNKATDVPEPNPGGLCMCGCGGTTPLAPQGHRARGLVAGKPMRYIPGHQSYGRIPWNRGLTRNEDARLAHVDTPTNPYHGVTAPEHPLATKNGQVGRHRMVLYDAIGPGPHKCHWCGREIHWVVGVRGGPSSALVVDHLDGNPHNNALENLVPSCQACNKRRANPDHEIKDGEPFVTWPDGSRHRAIERVCEHCGKTFLIAAAQVSGRRANDGKYCSRSCARRKS